MRFRLIILAPAMKVDDNDAKILELLLSGNNTKEISKICKIPLSTVQRRVRNVIHGGLVTSSFQLDFENLGFKTGLLHVYLRDGNIEAIAKKVYELDGINYIEIHIGNSDILANVIYKEGRDLLDLISKIKRMRGIDRIVWSERVYKSPYKKDIFNFTLNKVEKESE